MAAALALLVACSSPSAPRVPTGAIQIVPGESAAWSHTWSTFSGFSVPITITNNWDRTIYLVGGNCGVKTEQNIDGSWRMLPNQTVCALVGYPPTPIAPGESFTQAVFFSTNESLALPGQHRVIVGLAVKDGDEFRLLADHFSVSSPFLVTDGS
ncbi:MAG TPA: hypothetical protein VFS56_03420 [Gemmatimonadaceae bacterium]|nr:hypothetical protein [Gemmatimonadaceae bacterium]